MREGAPREQHGRWLVADNDTFPVPNDDFWAQITAFDGARWYSWVQVTEFPTGYFTPLVGGGSGSMTGPWPAREANRRVVQVGSYVKMRFADWDPVLDWTLVFDGEAAAIVSPCTDIEYDTQTKDQCDYPFMIRYVRTIVLLCGVIQTPLPAWENTGQVGWCADPCYPCISGTGTGSGVECCCPPVDLCISWPFANDPEMVIGLTLVPLFDFGESDVCKWEFAGILAGVGVTVTATWYGCLSQTSDVGQLLIDVVCAGLRPWATYVGDFPLLVDLCWDVTQQEIALWTGGLPECSVLGVPAPYVHVIKGPGPCRFDSGTGTGTGHLCPQPSTLCAYVPPGEYFGCDCANGAAVTLAYQGGTSYMGTLTLFDCPGQPSLFIYAMYYNDGTNWRLQIQVVGCGYDTGVNTFYGQSFMNCLAGLPQCVSIPSPNTCCGVGTGSGIDIVPFDDTGPGGGGPGSPGGDGFLVCVTNGPCIPSGTGTGTGTGEQWWCVLVTESETGSGGIDVGCCSGATLSTVMIATVANSGNVAIDGAYEMLFTGPSLSPSWSYSGQLGTCSVPPTQFSLLCTAGDAWVLNAPSSGYSPPSTENCPPLAFKLVFTGVDFTACGGVGSAATVTFTEAASGTGTGSGQEVYMCVSDADIIGELVIDGEVTVIGVGPGTIISGPYETPVCDNECPPITGTGIIPPPCCGWGFNPPATFPPPTLVVTFGAGLIGLGSIPVDLVFGTVGSLIWRINNVVTECGLANVTLVCNQATGTFTVSGTIDDLTGKAYVQFAASGYADSCNPFNLRVNDVTFRIPPGTIPPTANPNHCGIGPIGGLEWLAVVTLP